MFFTVLKRAKWLQEERENNKEFLLRLKDKININKKKIASLSKKNEIELLKLEIEHYYRLIEKNTDVANGEFVI